MIGVPRTALAALALVGLPVAAFAQDAAPWPPPGVSLNGDPGVPDVSGLWLASMVGKPGVAPAPNRGPADGEPQVFWTPWPLPFTAPYQKIVDERARAYEEGRQLGDISARCLPFGLPKMLVSQVYPNEIVQTPGQITFYFYGAFPLTVWTDGRGHPADLKPSFTGHSIGHWIGDTLFAETVGINGLTSLDHAVTPHSDKVRMDWTMRMTTPDRLQVVITITDPEALKEPITVVNIYRRKNDSRWQVLDDGSCFENNRTQVDEAGNTDGFAKF
jgi:hypothetical protein